MLFYGSWKMDPNRSDIGSYSPSASYVSFISVVIYITIIEDTV